MNLQEYNELKAQTNDPVYLCFLIYNKETTKEQIPIEVFTSLFPIWLQTRTPHGILQACAILRGYFDTIITE